MEFSNFIVRALKILFMAAYCDKFNLYATNNKNKLFYC